MYFMAGKMKLTLTNDSPKPSLFWAYTEVSDGRASGAR